MEGTIQCIQYIADGKNVDKTLALVVFKHMGWE